MTTAGAVYRYTATVVRVVDGDTIVVDVDLGFFVAARGQSIRLLGCNAHEHDTTAGAAARDHLTALLPPLTQITISTVKPDKFGGRYDAALTLPGGVDLVAMLIADGWAAPWNGRGTKPLPPWPHTVSP